MESDKLILISDSKPNAKGFGEVYDNENTYVSQRQMHLNADISGLALNDIRQ